MMSIAKTRLRRFVALHSLLLIAAVLGLAVLTADLLTSTSARVAGTSGTRPSLFVAELPQKSGERVCQQHTALPKGAGSLRLTVATFGRSGTTLTAYADGLIIGRLASGWREGVVDIPLVRRATDLIDFRLCFESSAGARLAFAGEPAGPSADIGGRPQSGRISVIGYTRDDESTLSLFPELGERIGRGSAEFVGPWSVVAICLLVMAAVAAGAGVVVASDGRVASWDQGPLGRFFRRFPIAGLAAAGATLALGLAWSLLIPPFQVADETSHVAYVQYLAETGLLPLEKPGSAPYSEDENTTLGAIGFGRIIGRSAEKVISTAAEEQSLRALERQEIPTIGVGNATTASANPPLYYMLQAPIYLATSRGSLLTQVSAMRLLSVLLTALSVLMVYMFCRELLPYSPWTWSAGALACAFQPVVGFTGAGVNPDSLLILASTGVLLTAARLLRRGLTVRRGFAFAAFVVAGLLTKPLFFALVPAAVCALVLGAIESRRTGKQVVRPLVLTSMAVAAPLIIYVALAAGPLKHPYFAIASDVGGGALSGGGGAESSLTMQASFLLQLFLPRFPLLTDLVPGHPIRDIWLNGLAGVFGWVDYQLPANKVTMFVWSFGGALGLAAVALVRRGKGVTAHFALAFVCLVALVGVLGAVGLTDYQAFLSGSARFQQARYLLPLLALYGGLAALATKALGPRLGRLVLPGLFVLVAAHTITAMVITADRYYL